MNNYRKKCKVDYLKMKPDFYIHIILNCFNETKQTKKQKNKNTKFFNTH